MEANAEKTMPTGILEKRIFTIGHSNLSFEQFVSLLKEFGICTMAISTHRSIMLSFSGFSENSLRDALRRSPSVYYETNVF